MKIGYEDMPYDLKMTFYELSQIRFDARENKTYLISRLEDSEGSTTTFRKDTMPEHAKEILYQYTGRRLVGG